MRVLRWIVGGMSLIVLASCRIVIVNPDPAGSNGGVAVGGVVKASKLNWTCPDYAKSCVFDVTDFYFDETFVAIPKDGYRFKHWKKGDRRFCGGSKKPCSITTTVFTGEWIPVVQRFLDNPDETFWIEPVFEKIASSVTSCSVFVGNTGFCDQGSTPNCGVTKAQAFEISEGMTYQQVVGILGCHGDLASLQTSGGITMGLYGWGDFSMPLVAMGVSFVSVNGSIPRVQNVIVN